MADTVTIRDLRNHGGEVLARVQAGETLTVTSHGTPIAELRPIRNRYLTTSELIERARGLPPTDPRKLREDIDAIIDQTL
ncbi:MAG: type II toxin-antitoxin system Phd/YefM family antitoxin [Solirubrobacteraceae bacterium]